ncbi:glycoside hydrolase family 28 protein [Granulicella aggregans]|jgi:hypothetical protein|uniref:glycoside hydrolase family 28 protein n=1 Tax=Granulicella aggregans TaxID=474949 RepID=UPI0021E0619C|nr:glycosyl hydrolase family 28-related protein [Granulicella aggregans]
MPVFNVKDFGAKGDGIASDTAAVTKTISACAEGGGGTVYFPAGRYSVGTVQLKSHIRLYLDAGAALVGSHNIQEYLPSPPFGFARHYGVDITGEGAVLGMLIAKDATDITLEGDGEIDGQSDSFMSPRTSHGGNDYDAQYVRNPEAFQAAMSTLEYGPIEPADRPGTMIVFYHCKNVHIHGITLRKAPNWTLHLQDVEDATLSGFQILNDPKVPNNDGIDCMLCRHVQISDCHIDAGDDGLAIVASEHVNVANCSLSSRSAAIRLESTQRSTFSGLTMDTNRGIAIFANGYLGQKDRPTEDVLFSNIVIRTHLIPGGWWGKAEPIYIAVQPCDASAPCEPRVRKVTFSNITAEAENGILFWGAPETPITGVELNGIRLHMVSPDPDLADSIGGNLDLRWTAIVPRDGIIKSDIPALYGKHVDGLRIRDMQIDWANTMPDYFTDGLRLEEFKDLTVDDFTGRQGATRNSAAIALKNGSGVAITNSRALSGTSTFLALDHVSDRRVFVNYDLSAATSAIKPAGKRFQTQIVAPAPRQKTP